MEAAIRDIRHAVRILARTPGFTVAVTLILAIGIGATSVVFSMIDFAFLRPLPVREPSGLAALFNYDASGRQYSSLSYPDFTDYSEMNTVFSGMTAYSSETVNLVLEGDSALEVTVDLVTGDYFEIIGVEPVIGRAFLPGELEVDSADRVVVLSHSLWRSHFAEEPSQVGREIFLNGQSYAVLGIMPEDFRGPDLGSSPDMWAPLTRQSLLLPSYGRRLFYNRGTHWLIALGRLKPDISFDRVREEFMHLSRLQAMNYLDTNEGWRIAVTEAGRGIVWPGYKGLIVFLVSLLLGIVGLVMLIVCFNISNLLMARAARRRREIGMRLALGASRYRLLRQLISESLLLALMGGTLGTLLAYWMIDILRATSIIGYMQGGLDLELGSRVLGFILLLSLVTAMTFGLLPALRSSRLELMRDLKDDYAAPAGRTKKVGPRNLLVVVQVAIALVLLVTAGLFAKSLNKQLNIELGFDTTNLVLAHYDLENAGYTDAAGAALQYNIVNRVRSIPGVVSASQAHILPMGRWRMATGVKISGSEMRPEEEEVNFEANIVAPGFFKTMGIPIVEGQPFSINDDRGGPLVAIVSQSAVQRFWAGESPVGRQIAVRTAGDLPVTIIGIARDVRHGRIVMGRTMIRESPPTVYLPMLQHYQPRFSLIVRTAGYSHDLIPAIDSAIKELDRFIPVQTETYDAYLSSRLAGPSLVTSVLRLSSLFALCLAALGLYGLVAFSVSRRTREFGIRIALGAQPGDVLGLVIRQGLIQVIWGIVLSLPVALALNQVLASILFGVTGFDIYTYGIFALLLLITGLMASYLPAKRAASINPMIALRSE